MAVILLLLASGARAFGSSGSPVAQPSPATKAPPGFVEDGSVPGSLPVTVSLAIPLRNTALLSQELYAVSDPSSPSFGHYQSEAELAQDFLPTQEFEDLLQYVSSAGLSVEFTALDSSIVVQGTASAVERAFGTGLEMYSNGTSSYYISTSGSFEGAYLLASNASSLVMKPDMAEVSPAGTNVTFTGTSLSPKLLRSLYNASGLYAAGVEGSRETIGILDWYGSPTIGTDLESFDSRYGLPQANLSVVPIGPYDPNLGASTGWNAEVSLDVEVSHMVAPDASIDLYIGNGALSLSDAVSYIVQYDEVKTLSQSFGTPEWWYSFLGPQFFDLNVLIPDQYYMLAGLEGITVTASTGDMGGSGYSSGPEGDLEYPSSSPYVTAVGGTQSYLTNGTAVQTAWSNLYYVGSTGGVSILEPKPWYQGSLATPASYPAGRMTPDVALQGGLFPAVDVVVSGEVVGYGGTSVSTQIMGALVALLDSYAGGSAGFLNPFLYGLAGSQDTYSKAYTPVTFGYNVPWNSSRGYNLVTGWGSPNAGEIASLYVKARSEPTLNVTVGLSPGVDSSGLEYVPGTKVNITALISFDGRAVTGGSFTAELQTLTGSTPVSLSYDPATKDWTGSLVMGDQEGLAYLNVGGSADGLEGAGFAPLFAGYLGTFVFPLPNDPWSTVGGLSVAVDSTTLDGNPAPAGPVGLDVDSYSAVGNRYVTSLSTSMPWSDVFGPQNAVVLNESIPSVPSTLVLTGGTYGYLPFSSGISLQASYVTPPVFSEPASVAPGENLTIVAIPDAPYNLYNLTSLETDKRFGSDVASGSNVTAVLVSPVGGLVSLTSLSYQVCPEEAICGGAPYLSGYLTVPGGSPPGLYTVVMIASYGSITIGEPIYGSYYSQVWVSAGSTSVNASVWPGFVSGTATSNSPIGSYPSGDLYEGEEAHVVATIAYPNGTDVQFGEYSAAIYPEALEGQYTTVMYADYLSATLVPLTYDPALHSWLGNVSLPGPSGPGALSAIEPGAALDSGPYEVYVSGVTPNGVSTPTSMSAQDGFSIQPYAYVTGALGSLQAGTGLAFAGATVNSSGSFAGDLFLGNDTFTGGSVTIADSQVSGTLQLKNEVATLVGVSGGNVAAVGSSLTLRDSSLDSLALNGSEVVMDDSSYEVVSPSLPSITVSGLSSPASVPTAYSVDVLGQDLASGSLSATIDGSSTPLQVSQTASGLSAAGTVDPLTLGDGVHTLVVTAAQTDGLSSTLSVSFVTDAQAASLSTQLKQADGNITSLWSQLDQAQQTAGKIFNITYALAAVAVIAVVLAVTSLRRKAPQA